MFTKPYMRLLRLVSVTIFSTAIKTSETLVTVKGAQTTSENIIGIAVGMVAILLVICLITLFVLRRRLACLNREKGELLFLNWMKNSSDIITPGHSLDKTYRLYQVPGPGPYGQGTTPAMTLDASKEFNVTLMLRQDQPIMGHQHQQQMGAKFKPDYNANRDSGIYSNIRNNSLSGSTSTGSEVTDKTLLQSSRTDLGIYL